MVSIYSLTVWLHVIFGITWIGLLYYFNFVQVPAVNQAMQEKEPSLAAINKYIAPRALVWFRWAAVLTWLSGVAVLEISGIGFRAFLFSEPIIGVGAWLGTIMLFNVWVFIWPNQQKVLGIKKATDEEKATAKIVALMASRANVVMSIPMLMCMVGGGASGLGLPF